MFPLRLIAAAAASTLALAAAPAHALDVASFSPDVQPCADFYEYVNGPWVARTELPADRTRIGSFDALRVANDRLLSDALA